MRVMLVGVGVAVAAAFGLSVWFSKSYWGYWPVPPQLDPRVLSAKRVIGMGGFQNGMRGNPNLKGWTALPTALRSTDPAEATEYPLEYTMRQWRAAGLASAPAGKCPIGLRELKRLPTDRRVRVKSDPGYKSDDAFWGFWSVLEGSKGENYLFVAGNGDEMSDDHQPHYRLLYRMNGSKLQLVGRQRFNFDCAGIEGLTWQGVFTMAAVVLGGIAVVVGCVALFVSAASQRRRETP
jgi:hypothetical protein